MKLEVVKSCVPTGKVRMYSSTFYITGSFHSIPSVAETTFRDFCFDMSFNLQYKENPYCLCIVDAHKGNTL